MKTLRILLLFTVALFGFACASEPKPEDSGIHAAGWQTSVSEAEVSIDTKRELGIYEDGVLALSDGSSFTGRISEGRIDCWGVLVTPKGGRYEGHFKGLNRGTWQNIRSMLNGQGECRYPNGGIYEGNFKEGRPEGRGTWHYSRGGLYKGSFRLGAREGFGTYVFPDGAKYIGVWKGDKFHGSGTYILPNGMKFTGNFLNGKIELNDAFTDKNIEESDLE